MNWSFSQVQRSVDGELNNTWDFFWLFMVYDIQSVGLVRFRFGKSVIIYKLRYGCVEESRLGCLCPFFFLFFCKSTWFIPTPYAQHLIFFLFFFLKRYESVKQETHHNKHIPGIGYRDVSTDGNNQLVVLDSSVRNFQAKVWQITSPRIITIITPTNHVGVKSNGPGQDIMSNW